MISLEAVFPIRPFSMYTQQVYLTILLTLITGFESDTFRRSTFSFWFVTDEVILLFLFFNTIL